MAEYDEFVARLAEQGEDQVHFNIVNRVFGEQHLGWAEDWLRRRQRSGRRRQRLD